MNSIKNLILFLLPVLLSSIFLIFFSPQFLPHRSAVIDQRPHIFDKVEDYQDQPQKMIPSGFITTNAGLTYRSLGFPASVSISKKGLTIQYIVKPVGGSETFYNFSQQGKTRLTNETVEIQHLNANLQSKIVPRSQQNSVINLFLGQDPANWHTKVPVFSSLEIRGIYPGITLKIDEADSNLKNSYILSPGADPSQIRWNYPGAGTIRINPNTRDCEVVGDDGQVLLVDQAPRAWQVRLGKPVPVSTSFKIFPDASLGFTLGDYDHSLPLIIDPTILFSTYLGGKMRDIANDVAVDANGFAYAAGFTESSDFPVTGPPISISFPTAAFIAKFSPSGGLIYSTIFGGSFGNEAKGIDIDQSGNAYVSGYTGSTDFPLVNPTQPSTGGYDDAFVSKFDPTGTQLLFSTYHGGVNHEYVYHQTLKEDGTLIVVGSVDYGGLPVTPGAFDPTPNGMSDGFLLAINPDLSTVLFSTYFGGNDYESIFDVVTNSNGESVIVGHTRSLDLPIKDAFQPQNTGGQCWYGACYEAFVSRLSADGTSLLYSTFLGGTASDYGRSIAVDADDNMIVFGMTDSLDFPTKDALQPVNMQGGFDGDFFITKLNNTGSGLIFSTFLGGSFQENASRIKVDSSGKVYFVGTTESYCIPKLSYLPKNSQDALIFVLEPDGKSISQFQYLDGSSSDIGFSLAIAPDNTLWAVGSTDSVDFPLVMPYDSSQGGNGDGFVAHVADDLPYFENMVFLPNTSKGGPEGIYGQLTKWECGTGNRKLELRYYDGTLWSTRAMAVTTNDGSFNFPDIPSLLPGEKYYVRYINDTGIDDSLSFYATRILTEYTNGTPLLIDRFWIDNFGPGIPSNGETQPIPVNFGWSTNTFHPNDSYEFILYDDHDQNVYFSSGLLGYTDDYTLSSLPSGFKAGKEYFWFNSFYTSNGGYGESYYEYSIRFVNSITSDANLGWKYPYSTRNAYEAANRFETRNR